MKKILCLMLAVCMPLTLAACGGSKQSGQPAETKAAAQTEAPAETESSAETTAPAQDGSEWTTEGMYTDENENYLTITWMDGIDEPGWYVGCMLGEDPTEDSWGGTLLPEGNSLHGTLPSFGEKDPLTVTVTPEGADGMQLAVEGGETYHFTVYDVPEATISVNISTEGMGNIEYAEGEEAPEIDTEYPYQSAQINLAEPTTHTFVAWPQMGNLFVKWTKNGEDFSTEPQITVLLDESADFVAVFEADPDWVDPLENYTGEYQCDRANAIVDSYGTGEASLTIQWGGSAEELAQWDIYGKLDLETMSLKYSDCTKSIIVYDENGDVKSHEPEREDCSGTITFNEDGTFTWHDDQSEYETDMVFEKMPEAE